MIKLTSAQQRAVALRMDIERACIEHGLNLTIHDGKIGFVDQRARKIVYLWSADHALDELDVWDEGGIK